MSQHHKGVALVFLDISVGNGPGYRRRFVQANLVFGWHLEWATDQRSGEDLYLVETRIASKGLFLFSTSKDRPSYLDILRSLGFQA